MLLGIVIVRHVLVRHNQSIMKGSARLFKDENAKLVYVLTQQSASFLLHPVIEQLVIETPEFG